MSPTIGLAAFAFAYVISQFYRTAIAVVAPEVAADLDLDATLLGTLSAVWFAAFAGMQFPVGVALDRWGTRRTVAVLMTAAAAGAAVFAAADGLVLAVIGQALIGIGCSPIFTGTMVAVSRWFPPERFAPLSSLILACAIGGALLSSRPFAMAAEWLGWRGALLAVAGLTLVSLVLVALFARGPSEAASGGKREGLGELLAGVGEVLRLRALWPILPLCFFAYAVLIGLRALWSGSYLAAVFGLSAVERGDVVLLMSLGMLADTLAYAWAERRYDARRAPVLIGTLLTVLVLIGLILAGDGSVWLAGAGLTAIGAVASTYVLIVAQGRRFLPEHQTGRGIAYLTFVGFSGAAITQQVSGLVLQAATDAGLPPSAAYGWLFGFMALALALSLVVYAFSPDAAKDASP